MTALGLIQLFHLQNSRPSANQNAGPDIMSPVLTVLQWLSYVRKPTLHWSLATVYWGLWNSTQLPLATFMLAYYLSFPQHKHAIRLETSFMMLMLISSCVMGERQQQHYTEFKTSIGFIQKIQQSKQHICWSERVRATGNTASVLDTRQCTDNTL